MKLYRLPFIIIYFWPLKCREKGIYPFQVNVQYNFVANMNDQSVCCVSLNVCGLEQELWSKGNYMKNLIFTKLVFQL